MKALKGKIIVEDLEEGKVTPGGIVIPDTHNEKNMMGTVISTGIKDVKVGDILLYGRYAGKQVEWKDSSYRNLGGDDILAITNGTLDSISPVSDFLIVEPIEAETKTSSGLYLIGEENKAEDFKWAKVIKVGPGRFTVKGVQIKTTVEIGQEVMYAPYTGFQLKAHNRTLVMIRESHLEAVRS